MTQETTDKIFDAVTGDDDGDDTDLTPEAHKAEPRNFLRHVAALSASKIADGLIDPKLVLSWLLSHLGAGAFLTGLLVPIREAGALLPQLFTTPRITASAIRKWFWAGGALMQGVMAALIVLTAVTLEGAVAGAIIVGLLAVLALARSVCSASYKDILGKTVAKTRRGSATGLASSAAAAGVILFALVLMVGIGDRFVVVVGAIALAACFWAIAATVFATLKEAPSDPEERAMSAQFGLLRKDPQLARFIIVRSLLIGTALTPPYLVLLQPDTGLDQLGALVLASAVASLISSYVWGRVSDRSSARVLRLSGLAGGVVLTLVVVLTLAGGIGAFGVLPLMLLGLMVSYHGVRQGRSTHLVDMAGPNDRASYTALSNTVVGLVLLAVGVVSAGVAAISVPLVIGLFAVMCFLAAIIARGLEEVQDG